MRIVIDMQGAQTASRFRGIGRYTLSLAKAIVRNRGEHQILLLLNGLLQESLQPIRLAFEGLLPAENMLVWTAPDPVHISDPANRGREALAKLLREEVLASLQPDMVCISSFFEGYTDNAVTSIRQLDMRTPVCAITYDFIPLLNPGQYLDHDPAYARYYKDKVQELARADLLLAISESSRLEALEHLGLPPGQVVNIAAACDACFQPLSHITEAHRAVLKRWGITRPFVLYTGGADDRKNLPRLIEAFARLPQPIRQRHQLLFAGKLSASQQGQLQGEAARQGLTSEDLRFTGFVSDDDLVLAYSLCQLFVFPSWHEGFGLPPLEAMSCGAPVIAANTSSLPEVVGWEEALFDPFDVDAISRKMARALGEVTFADALKAHAPRQCQQFSWDRSAITAIEAMARIHQGRLAAETQTRLTPNRSGYENLLSACVDVLKKHRLTSADDLTSLADCMAHNEAQAAQYFQAVQRASGPSQTAQCENRSLSAVNQP